MFRFRDRLQARIEELATLVTREHGKTIAEARAEMQRGLEMVEFACGIPSLLMGQSLENLAVSVDCETNRHPLGLCVGITPFNFPSMVPLWMIPVAITCGNTKRLPIGFPMWQCPPISHVADAFSNLIKQQFSAREEISSPPVPLAWQQTT